VLYDDFLNFSFLMYFKLRLYKRYSKHDRHCNQSFGGGRVCYPPARVVLQSQEDGKKEVFLFLSPFLP